MRFTSMTSKRITGSSLSSSEAHEITESEESEWAEKGRPEKSGKTNKIENVLRANMFAHLYIIQK